MGTAGCPCSQDLVHSHLPQFRKPFLATLPLFPHDASQAAADPRVKLLQSRRRLTEAEIAPPIYIDVRDGFYGGDIVSRLVLKRIIRVV